MRSRWLERHPQLTDMYCTRPPSPRSHPYPPSSHSGHHLLTFTHTHTHTLTYTPHTPHLHSPHPQPPLTPSPTSTHPTPNLHSPHPQPPLTPPPRPYPQRGYLECIQILETYGLKRLPSNISIASQFQVPPSQPAPVDEYGHVPLHRPPGGGSLHTSSQLFDRGTADGNDRDSRPGSALDSTAGPSGLGTSSEQTGALWDVGVTCGVEWSMGCGRGGVVVLLHLIAFSD